ncbi:DNA recombination protein RmuC, partial [Salmonella enterica subsp. enterica serovar Cerro]|nr:DNA recombination protein RmuC [Salmonella enterica subsp. enterica serovar Cerro]
GQGESTPKARPKGVVDGKRVNIPVLGVTAKGGRRRLCWPGDGRRKDYQQLPGLRSLDYVLMFIPVEPAFLLALDKQPELITEAL